MIIGVIGFSFPWFVSIFYTHYFIQHTDLTVLIQLVAVPPLAWFYLRVMV